MKKIIITADDLGISSESNDAVREGILTGTLTSSCILANGNAFEDALEKITKSFPQFDLGIHLNIIEGKSLINNGKSYLTNENGIYNQSFLKMLLMSWDKNFLRQTEAEFRAQIEKIINAGIKPSYINSHVHIHSIPNIFAIACKLAKEYNIPCIRTQAEHPYIAKGFFRHTNFHYIVNIIKNIILNLFTLINRSTAKKYGLKTNSHFIGVLYTGNMDIETITAGIKVLKDNTDGELILHPTTNPKKKTNYNEYKTLINPTLTVKLKALDTKLVNWSD